MMEKPEDKWRAYRPRVGAPITCRGEPVGIVSRVDGGLCWAGDEYLFIWCFRDGLNNLHDWPGKKP